MCFYNSWYNLCLPDDIVDCLESISSSYSDILRRNRVVVTYLQNLEERKERRLDQDVKGVEEIDHSLSQDDT